MTGHDLVLTQLRRGTRRKTTPGMPLLALAAAALLTGCAPSGEAALPSWRDGPSRDAVVAFVERVSDPASPDHVPPAERIAVFDNDGTLWAEQPLYFQLAFILDEVRAQAPQHPEWRTRQPFQAVLEGDMETLAEAGTAGLLELALATQAGLTTTDYADDVAAWLADARHPSLQRPYPELVYQPMLELLDYLRANGFRTWIVSGGGADFVRVFSEERYGIPPEQVVGSETAVAFALEDGVPVLRKQGELAFVDDKEGKPVGIHRFIGRRPIAAFGNSDGDLAMLQWTVAGEGARLALLVHHTDAEREFAYDRESHIGRLDQALDEAGERGWVVVDMARDWEAIFPPEGR